MLHRVPPSENDKHETHARREPASGRHRLGKAACYGHLHDEEAAVRATEEGTPMMRPMCFDFPDNPACDYLDQQFMLGDSLLVSSVFDAAGVKATYVPAGAWTDFRSGAVLLVSEVDDRFDYSYAEGVTLRVFEVDAVATSEIVIPDPAAGAGARFALTRAEDSVLFEPVAGTGDRRVQFVGRQGASSVWEGVAESDPMGLIVEPTEGRVRWALG